LLARVYYRLRFVGVTSISQSITVWSVWYSYSEPADRTGRYRAAVPCVARDRLNVTVCIHCAPPWIVRCSFYDSFLPPRWTLTGLVYTAYTLLARRRLQSVRRWWRDLFAVDLHFPEWLLFLIRDLCRLMPGGAINCLPNHSRVASHGVVCWYDCYVLLMLVQGLIRCWHVIIVRTKHTALTLVSTICHMTLGCQNG